jgi:nucleoside 2-deoxyribosyltransferase
MDAQSAVETQWRRTPPIGLPPKIYCAGPLFNSAERQEMTAIADALEAAGFRVYLPHRDGMEFRLIHLELERRGWNLAVAGQVIHAAIFALDLYELVVDCAGVLWNLNGRVPDEGAVSEAAIAWTLGKPLAIYQDDVRSMIAGRVNPLLVGLTDFTTFPTIDGAVEQLARAFAEQLPRLVAADQLPPAVRRAALAGEELWLALQESTAAGDDARIADEVSRLFGQSQSPAAGHPAIHTADAYAAAMRAEGTQPTTQTWQESWSAGEPQPLTEPEPTTMRTTVGPARELRADEHGETVPPPAKARPRRRKT